MTNIIAIGYMGKKVCYIGLTKDEACERYDAENPDYKVLTESLSVETIPLVNHSFCVYDIWENQ